MRERFCKSGNPAEISGIDFRASLRDIFLTFDFQDFRDELEYWLELSMSNDRASYQEASDREDVIDFCKELVKLIEAFYSISVSGNTIEKHADSGLIRPKRNNYINQINSRLSTNGELPAQVILHFRNMFSSTYVDLELLGMLDSVITYEGVKEVNRENLILFYKYLRYFVQRAYTFENI